jgi:hypothetical protein
MEKRGTWMRIFLRALLAAAIVAGGVMLFLQLQHHLVYEDSQSMEPLAISATTLYN